MTYDLFRLDGQVAIVTGGGSGIGLATVKRLLASGASVVLADLVDASELTEELGAVYCHCDVSNEQSVKDLMSFTIQRFGRLDILVNNAGVFAPYKKLTETDESDFDFCFNINLKGVAFGIKHAAPVMENGGRIVNTASAAGLTGALDLSSYVASKHAVVGLTKSAALELGSRNIRVNCVCPTTVNTPMAHADGGEFMIEGEKLTVPLGRICEAEDVAALIHFLASNDCGFVNGAAIAVDGGMSAGITEAAFSKLMS
ncbi:MAG: SDR family oxidoreductase [Pseudomonadales bacterium]